MTQATKPSADKYHDHYCFGCHGYYVCLGTECSRLLEKLCPKHGTIAKPSAGALRAAKEWYVYPKDSRVESLAYVIDRETGMAELLRTAKWAHKLLLFKRFIGFTKELEEFGQAIAKCERTIP